MSVLSLHLHSNSEIRELGFHSDSAVSHAQPLCACGCRTHIANGNGACAVEGLIIVACAPWCVGCGRAHSHLGLHWGVIVEVLLVDHYQWAKQSLAWRATATAHCHTSVGA